MNEPPLRPPSRLFVTTAGIRSNHADDVCRLFGSPIIQEFCDGVVLAGDTRLRLGTDACRDAIRQDTRHHPLLRMVEQPGPGSPAEADLVLDLLHEIWRGIRPLGILMSQHHHPELTTSDFVAEAYARIGNRGSLTRLYTRSAVTNLFHDVGAFNDRLTVATEVLPDVHGRPPARKDSFGQTLSTLIRERGAHHTLYVVLRYDALTGLEEAKQVELLRDCRQQISGLNRRYQTEIDFTPVG